MKQDSRLLIATVDLSELTPRLGNRLEICSRTANAAANRSHARHTCVKCENYESVIAGSGTAKLIGVMRSIARIVNDFSLLGQMMV